MEIKMYRVRIGLFWTLLLIVNGGTNAAIYDVAVPQQSCQEEAEILGCDDVTNATESRFVNPNYPNFDNGVGKCQVTVNIASSDICQIRLDFIEFELAQPNVNGACFTDFFTVEGGTSAVPVICGSNNGQHMYVDVHPSGGPVNVVIDRISISASVKNWNIKIQQIPCCFRGTPQIANTVYAVCIEKVAGYCGITWTRNPEVGNIGFTISGNVVASNPSIIGTPYTSATGTHCTSDYIIIPGGRDDQGYSADRYCGLGFPYIVKSTLEPFSMYVITDGDEFADSSGTTGSNNGFSLNYRQTIDC